MRAAMEGIALNLGAVLEVLKEFCTLNEEMLIVGGGSKSPLWRQIFADVFGMAVVKTNVDQDAGSLGAAAIGAVGTGLWKDFSRIEDVHVEEGREGPGVEAGKIYAKMREEFELQRKHCAELGDFIKERHS